MTEKIESIDFKGTVETEGNPEYKKARELGTLILNSDYKKNLNEALEAYESNSVAKQKFENYIDTKSDYMKRLRKKQIAPEDIKQEQQKIEQMGLELEYEEDIVYLLNAEEEYNDYVNKIMQLLKATIQEGKGCGGLGGCGGGGCSK